MFNGNAKTTSRYKRYLAWAGIMVKVHEHFLLKSLDKRLFTYGKMLGNVIATAHEPLNNLLRRLSVPNIHFLILLSSKSINQCARNWVDGHDISSLNKCLPSNLFRIWFFVQPESHTHIQLWQLIFVWRATIINLSHKKTISSVFRRQKPTTKYKMKPSRKNNLRCFIYKHFEEDKYTMAK